MAYIAGVAPSSLSANTNNHTTTTTNHNNTTNHYMHMYMYEYIYIYIYIYTHGTHMLHMYARAYTSDTSGSCSSNLKGSSAH